MGNKNVPKSIKMGIFLSLLFVTIAIVSIAYLLVPKSYISINILTSTSTPITKNVLVLNFNPTIESQNNKKLTEVKNWLDPLVLQQEYIDTIKVVSHGYVNYNIVETNTIDDFPIKPSSYDFTDEEYLACSTARNCNSELLNFQELLTQYNVCDRVNKGEIDELWLWGGPWFGYLEALMAGPGGYFTNGGPITGTSCLRQLNVMGFNYERSVAEMLHNLGHRSEGVMRHVYKNTPNDPYSMFIRYNQKNPGISSCGNVHFPPNGTSDYNYNNSNVVENTCEDWLSYPELSGAKQSFNCDQWGCNQLGYLKWWLQHLPHKDGVSDGTLNNWWKYIVDYESAITTNLPDIQIPTATTYCEGSTSLATITWTLNSGWSSDYMVDINDAVNAWNYTNGFWHTTIIAQNTLSATIPTELKNAYLSTELMPALDPSKTYYARVFYRSLNIYSDTVSFIPKNCTSSIPGDFTDTGDTPTDQVNIFDYNTLVLGFGTTYSIFDYNDLITNYAR